MKVYEGDTLLLQVEPVENCYFKWDLYSDLLVDFSTSPGNALNDEAYFVDDVCERTEVYVVWRKPGIYFFRVSVIDLLGCTNNLELGIVEVLSTNQRIVTNENSLFIPEGFSPNGDGIHDYFQMVSIEKYPEAHLYIFDRVGNKIFDKNNYGNVEFWGSFEQAWWNGESYRNKKVPLGNYLYILDTGMGGQIKGFVMVLY